MVLKNVARGVTPSPCSAPSPANLVEEGGRQHPWLLPAALNVPHFRTANLVNANVIRNSDTCARNITARLENRPVHDSGLSLKPAGVADTCGRPGE